jgi:hypothetical protein
LGRNSLLKHVTEEKGWKDENEEDDKEDVKLLDVFKKTRVHWKSKRGSTRCTLRELALEGL